MRRENTARRPLRNCRAMRTTGLASVIKPSAGLPSTPLRGYHRPGARGCSSRDGSAFPARFDPRGLVPTSARARCGLHRREPCTAFEGNRRWGSRTTFPRLTSSSTSMPRRRRQPSMCSPPGRRPAGAAGGRGPGGAPGAGAAGLHGAWPRRCHSACAAQWGTAAGCPLRAAAPRGGVRRPRRGAGGSRHCRSLARSLARGISADAGRDLPVAPGPADAEAAAGHDQARGCGGATGGPRSAGDDVTPGRAGAAPDSTTGD
jgi:hypothetical protein